MKLTFSVGKGRITVLFNLTTTFSCDKFNSREYALMFLPHFLFVVFIPNSQIMEFFFIIYIITFVEFVTRKVVARLTMVTAVRREENRDSGAL